MTDDLLRAAAARDDPERQQLVDRVVVLNLELAETLARRYSRRGLEPDDLAQVAHIGLILAARRFDPSFGRSFLAYAVPTIIGELKRHFRQHGWGIRPPRRVQELNAAILAARPELEQASGTDPTPAELAEALDVDVEHVIEALEARHCYTPLSMDHRVHDDADGDVTLANTLGSTETGYRRTEAIVALAPACRELPPRDQHILYLRFFKGWTQQEIGDDLGVTQMQVSRLLTRILNRLRDSIDDQPPELPPRHHHTQHPSSKHWTEGSGTSDSAQRSMDRS